MPPTTLADIRRNKNLTRGYVANTLNCSVSFLAQIEKHGNTLAPNHPLVPKLAEVLGLTIPEVQVFCKHEPFTNAQLKLATFRLGRKLESGKPRGPRYLGSGDAAADSNGRVESLQAAREAKGLTRDQMAEKLHISSATIVRVVETPLGLAPNHPLIPKLAKFLGLSEDEVRRHAKKRALDEHAVGQVLRHLGKPGPNKGKSTLGRKKENWHQRAMRKRREAKGEPGTALVHVRKGRDLVATATKRAERAETRAQAKRAYNSLRLMSQDVRQAARSLTTAASLAAIRGHALTEVVLPTSSLAAILNDWLRLRGIPEPVAVGVDYDQVFG